MRWLSITHAHEYWQSQRRLPDSVPNLDEAEIFILSTAPATPHEAACILDIIHAYGFDARCDGLDLAALSRLRSLLAQP